MGVVCVWVGGVGGWVCVVGGLGYSVFLINSHWNHRDNFYEERSLKGMFYEVH